MNNQELTMQRNESPKYQAWVLEFDTNLKVGFDDEIDFDDNPEI